LSVPAKNPVLIEGAFFAVLMSLAGLLSLYVPVLSFLAGSFISLLIAILIQRRDLKTGLIAVIIFTVLVFLFRVDNLTILLLIVHTVPLGLVLGLLFKNHAGAGLSICFSSLTLILFTFLGVALTFWITGLNPLAAGGEMKQVIARVADWYVQAGLTQELPLGELEAILEETVKTFIQFLPAHLIISSVVDAFLVYWLAGIILRRLDRPIMAIPPLVQWQFPWYTCWGLITGLGLALTGDYWKITTVGVLGKNILYIAGFLYLVAGISVCAFYMAKWKVPRLIKAAFIIFTIFYLPLALMILIVLGIMDSFVNWRHIAGTEDTEDKD